MYTHNVCVHDAVQVLAQALYTLGATPPTPVPVPVPLELPEELAAEDADEAACKSWLAGDLPPPLSLCCLCLCLSLSL